MIHRWQGICRLLWSLIWEDMASEKSLGKSWCKVNVVKYLLNWEWFNIFHELCTSSNHIIVAFSLFKAHFPHCNWYFNDHTTQNKILHHLISCYQKPFGGGLHASVSGESFSPFYKKLCYLMNYSLVHFSL